MKGENTAMLLAVAGAHVCTVNALFKAGASLTALYKVRSRLMC